MKRMALTLGLAAGLLAACGGDPMKPSLDALAAKDDLKADTLLSQLVASKPDLKPAHMQLFVLAQYLAAQGDPARQKAYQEKGLAQYDWLVKAYGVAANYADMEGSLKASPQAAADLAAARKPIYGD